MLTTNSILLERKKSLRKKMGIAFAKNPEITEEMMDFLETLIAQVSDISQTVYEAHRVQNKHEIREELSKELVSKKNSLTEVRHQSEISMGRTNFQTALIILMILLTTPGGIHLLEKVFAFLR